MISAILPPQSLSEAVGSGFGAKILMLLAGIPVYVCLGVGPDRGVAGGRGCRPGRAGLPG
ncbi:MAG: hypothetical protein U1F77_00765 [Kiritimatiellia bacterium]